jgi:hypothetical protein
MGGIALASGCKEEVFSQVTRLSFPSTQDLPRESICSPCSATEAETLRRNGNTIIARS